MEQWPDQDRAAFALSLGRANASGLTLWAGVSVLAAASLAVSESGRAWVPSAVLALSAVLAAGHARLQPVAAARTSSRVGAGLSLTLSLVTAWAMVMSPATVTLTGPIFVVIALTTGLLFTWPLATAGAVLGGCAVGWLVGVSLGPGWGSDPVALSAATLLVLGAAALSFAGQRRRLRGEQLRFEAVREAERTVAEAAGDQLRLQASEQEKDRIYGDASDDLREPVVRVLRDLDEQRGADAEQAARLDPAWQDGLRLLRKLDDLRTLARIERGHLRLRLQRVDLRRHVAQLVETLAPLVEEGGGSLELVVHGVPDDIHVDPVRLERVLVVLVSRAVARGGELADVQVELSVLADAESGEQACIEVWCDAPDDAWAPEPQGRARRGYRAGPTLEERVARALVEFHRGRLDGPQPGGATLSWKVHLHAGTEHVTNDMVDRRFNEAGGGARRMGDREEMAWAERVEESEPYRHLDVALAVREVAEQAGVTTPA